MAVEEPMNVHNYHPRQPPAADRGQHKKDLYSPSAKNDGSVARQEVVNNTATAAKGKGKGKKGKGKGKGKGKAKGEEGKGKGNVEDHSSMLSHSRNELSALTFVCIFENGF